MINFGPNYDDREFAKLVLRLFEMKWLFSCSLTYLFPYDPHDLYFGSSQHSYHKSLTRRLVFTKDHKYWKLDC